MNHAANPPTAAPPVPVIPESAPFNAEQRAWLNGFLAGMFSRAPASRPVAAGEPAVETLKPLTVLFGSQTGNAESLAKRAAKVAGQRGFAATAVDLADFNSAELARESNVLLIASTYGEGEPPDAAKGFHEFLHRDQAPKLPELRYSVCALGDTNYEKFCQCGRDLDSRLEALGARRVHERTDCDVDFEEPFGQWLDAALEALSHRPKDAGGRQSSGAPKTPEAPSADAKGGDAAKPINGEPRAYSRANPFPARLAANRLLNGPGSAKETRHFEIDLTDSGLTYEAGDALGVAPTNCPELVDELIRALRCDPETPTAIPGGARAPLREALLFHYDITRISKAMLERMARLTGDGALGRLVAPGANGALEKFLWGREVIDLLLEFPNAGLEAGELAGLLKKLQPRLYSISSSPKAHAGQVHLTINVVRFESLGRARKGVCSSFLADRARDGTAVPVFVHSNKKFRMPSDGARPMIMVGPGTGVAPFRGFLHERRAAGATGPNWLFFGDQRESSDFLYREELEALKKEGVLTRLDSAFSRDQSQKIYVQHRMLERAKELFDWLERGAHFYVCGDAHRMAKDVDAALRQVVELGGGKSADQASEYIHRLSAEKRYQRDVY